VEDGELLEDGFKLDSIRFIIKKDMVLIKKGFSRNKTKKKQLKRRFKMKTYSSIINNHFAWDEECSCLIVYLKPNQSDKSN